MTVTVLSVASEVFPLVKTGGLADVIGGLPAAVGAEDVTMHTLVPGYPAVISGLREVATVHEFAELHGGPARILAGSAAGLALFVLDAPHLFARPGNPYVGPDGADWPDNPVRFAALAAVGAALGRGLVPTFVPDVVHAHDWQAGLAPALLHYGGGPRPATLMTVHNLAFQGLCAPDLLSVIGLPPAAFTIDGVEFHGRISFLKAGLATADHLTTVSPTYAAEIRSDEHGMGMDGLLRRRASELSGIVNGIDVAVWNPATDATLASRFDARHLTARAANKAALQAQLGLALDPSALLFGLVSRLTRQKGIDLLLEALPALVGEGAQLALLGAGDAAFERAFTDAAQALHGRVAVVLGYDEALAHRMQAGADAILVPSRFEPCGLTQLCALRYGAIPVVARVGGLADTVIDANEMALAAKAGTGVVFSPVTRTALEIAIERTGRLWRDRTAWRGLQRRAMATDVSWARPASEYAALYRALAARRTD